MHPHPRLSQPRPTTADLYPRAALATNSRPQGELFHEPLPRQLPVYKFGPEDEAATMPATRH